MAPRPVSAPRQRSFDDLEVPLREVEFCAVDLETTSGSWRDGEIVEIGAVKSRGGEITGTFETFVQPSCDIPVEIQLLTGITPGMVASAAPLPVVLPSFIEFCRASVFVAHNARFDKSFLDAACRRLDYEISAAPIVDTMRLARRVLRSEVRSCGLHTLSAHFRTAHKPSHRAFPDAAACLEVLWALIERGAAYGITTLADLLHVQSVRSNPHFEKVKLARDLPRTRGVYIFTNTRGEIVYVGKAADLRSRVRSYFTSDERKRMGDLRAEASSVRVIACATEAHAAGLEARLIAEHRPRYNRAGVRRHKPAYLRMTADRHPRFSVGTSASGFAVGPFATAQRARAAAATLSGLFGIRTCTLRLDGRPHEPCALYELGSCHGPCTGRDTDVAAHDRAVAVLRDDLSGCLAVARGRLAAKLASLAEQARFEEAAAHRDAFGDVVAALDRARRLRALADAGRVELDTPDGPVVFENGRLPGAPESGSGDTATALGLVGLEERRAVAGWFERAEGVRVVSSSAPLAYPWPRVAPLDRICVERPQHRAGSGVQ
jgi:DNA polymerase-3 subunit epsilon